MTLKHLPHVSQPFLHLPQRLPLTPSPLSTSSLTFTLPTAVQGTQEDDPDSPALLDTMQESFFSYWSSAKAAAEGLYRKTYLTSVDEKLRCVPLSGDTFQPPSSDPGVQAPALFPQTLLP